MGSGHPPPARARTTILVVDASGTTQHLVRQALPSPTFEVIAAFDGAAALRIVRRRPIDLAIVDAHLPALDGFTLVRWLRCSDGPEVASLPVALLTSCLDVEEDTSFDTPATLLLKKPLTVAGLDRLLRHRPLGRVVAESTEAVAASERPTVRAPKKETV